MIYFSKNISLLRKRNNLTQEELGTKLGVSAQAISKWENSVSMPDICLLPMIAEALGVSIDELFGVDKRSSTLNDEDFPITVYEDILDKIAPRFNMREAKDAYKKYLEEKNNYAACVVFTESGAVFEDEDIGIVFPKPSNEAIKLLEYDKAYELLPLISDKTVLTTIAHLAKTKQFATVASISNNCSIKAEDVRLALEKIKVYKLVDRQVINMDSESIEVWRITRTHSLLFIYAILKIAKRAAFSEDNYFYYQGNDSWCY